MTFTADQYSQIAQGYENAASDPLVTAEKRADLAKQADWFRFLAQRQRSHRSSNDITAPSNLDGERKSPRRTWRSMMPFLTTLWITGAAVYLVGTVLFTNAVNLFGTEPKKPVVEVKRPVESVPNVAMVQREITADEGNPRVMAQADRRHAISPDQPTYESPTLTVPSTPLPQQELASPAPPVPVQDVVKVQPTEMFIVTSAATIRSGPSTGAKKIGTATAGAELQVKGREKEWVHFIDPSSGNTGWIQSSLVAPASQSGVEGVALPEHAEPPPEKPAKLAKKKLAPAQVSPRPRPRAYADLPPDEEFLPPRRRGPGLLSRRRMLRDGLMSPDFLPPGR